MLLLGKLLESAAEEGALVEYTGLDCWRGFRVHLGILIALYGLTLYFGSGIWLLLAPCAQRRAPAALFCTAPLVGLAWVGLFLANAFTLELPFGPGCVVLATSTTILNGYAYWRYRTDLGVLARSLRRHHAKAVFYTGLTSSFSIALLLPVIDKPVLTMPWRIGPDAVGYVGAAQFLVRGRVHADLTPDNIYLSSIFAGEFLWHALRRGFSLTLAFLSFVLHLHPVQLGFYFAAFCCVLMFLAGLRLFAMAWAKGDTVATSFAALAFGMNCNLLVVLFEGGYGQVSSMALAMGVLIGVFSFRRTSERAENVRLALLVALLASAAVTYYTESAFPMLMAFGGYLVLSLLRNRLHWRWNFVIAPLLVPLLSPEIVISWFAFQIRNVGNLVKGNVGWPQPQWPFAAEVLGLRDMYDAPISTVIRIIPPNEPDGRILFLSVAVSLIFFAGTCAIFFRERSSAPQWLFLTTGLILALHLFFRFELGTHSYPYTKMAVFFTPMLCLGLFGTLRALFRRPVIRTLLGGVLVLVIAYTGIGFLRTYRASAYFLTQGDLELARVPRIQGKRIVLPLLGVGGRHQELSVLLTLLDGKLTHPSMLGAQPGRDWANDQTPVLLLQKKRKDGLVEAPFADIAAQAKVLWRGSEYALLDPNLTASEVFQLYAQR